VEKTPSTTSKRYFSLIGLLLTLYRSNATAPRSAPSMVFAKNATVTPLASLAEPAQYAKRPTSLGSFCNLFDFINKKDIAYNNLFTIYNLFTFTKLQ
jgi:hypothetical protein